MTRHKWTTTEQEDWLKFHLADFGDAQAKKTTSKIFFPMVVKEWKTKWPTPNPTVEEIMRAGNSKKATQRKRADEENVC